MIPQERFLFWRPGFPSRGKQVCCLDDSSMLFPHQASRDFRGPFGLSSLPLTSRPHIFFFFLTAICKPALTFSDRFLVRAKTDWSFKCQPSLSARRFSLQPLGVGTRFAWGVVFKIARPIEFELSTQTLRPPRFSYPSRVSPPRFSVVISETSWAPDSFASPVALPALPSPRGRVSVLHQWGMYCWRHF